MKLGTKIFSYVMIFFSIVFLAGGYLLLSGFFEALLQREITNASEQYQYNKFVIQSVRISKGEEWFQRALEGRYDLGAVTRDMSRLAGLYRQDGTALYSTLPERTDVSALLSGVEKHTINYSVLTVGESRCILVAGMVAETETPVYLVTGLEISGLLRQQRQMTRRFGMVYAGAVCFSLVLVFFLSALLTRQLRRLAAAAGSIARGNYGERILLRGNDELGQLAEDFNRMAQAVETQVEQLSKYARQQEDFVANFSHELKTPLTSIIGYANRIENKELSRQEQKKAAAYIRREGKRLESLSHKMMDLTRMDRGSFVLQETMADACLQAFLADAGCFLEAHQVQAYLTAEPAMIGVERELLRTLFFNLLDNAVKAGADRIDICGRVCPGQGEAAPGYEISVEDNGSGIPKEELGRITEAFYMVDKSRSRKHHGAGLGLALAQKIAALHEGSLHFVSCEGEGTKVILRIPLLAGEAGGENNA